MHFASNYDSALRVAQPALFGELAIMLWLLIKAQTCKRCRGRRAWQIKIGTAR